MRAGPDLQLDHVAAGETRRGLVDIGPHPMGRRVAAHLTDRVVVSLGDYYRTLLIASHRCATIGIATRDRHGECFDCVDCRGILTCAYGYQGPQGDTTSSTATGKSHFDSLTTGSCENSSNRRAVTGQCWLRDW